MLLTTHALTGAVIGKYLENSWVVIFVALISHFIMDRFRHGEYLNRRSGWQESWKVILDLSIGGLVIGMYFYLKGLNFYNANNIAIGVFFSLLPDGFTLLYWKLRVKFLKIIFDFHARMHRYPPFSPEREWNFKNLRNDILFSMIAILMLFL